MSSGRTDDGWGLEELNDGRYGGTRDGDLEGEIITAECSPDVRADRREANVLVAERFDAV